MIRPEREADDAREAAALRDALRRASLDAARRDLWPRLEAEVQALGRPRRRWLVSPPSLRAFASATLIVAVIVALLVGALVFAQRRTPTDTVGSVPDVLLALNYQAASAAGGYDVAALRPGGAPGEPFLAGAVGVPTIAPDGRQLFFITQAREGQSARTQLVAHDSDTLFEQWSVPLGVQAVSDLGEHALLVRVAVTTDRVYVATFRLGLDDPLVVRVLARATGATLAEWPIATDGRIINELNLLAAPDGGTLHLFARLATGATRDAAVQDRHVAIALPDGRQEARTLAGDLLAATAFYGAGGRIAPDGRTFYRLTFEGKIVFFDLARDTRPTTLVLPFASVAGRLIPLGQGIAPDGRTLYALAPLVGQLAVIDLPGRRIERVVQLGGLPTTSDTSPLTRLRDWLAPGAAASGNFTPTIQVSPDGRRLYAAGAAGGQLGGIWVIATDDWRVAAHWQPTTSPSGLLLLDQGRSLAVQADGRVRILAVATGQVTADLAEAAALITSLDELYREQHGRAPGQPPSP